MNNNSAAKNHCREKKHDELKERLLARVTVQFADLMLGCQSNGPMGIALNGLLSTFKQALIKC